LVVRTASHACQFTTAIRLRVRKDYPLPLVDIQLAMRHAKSEIALARKRHLNRYETQEVLRQHGSRSTSRRRVKPKKTSSAQQSSLF